MEIIIEICTFCQYIMWPYCSLGLIIYSFVNCGFLKTVILHWTWSYQKGVVEFVGQWHKRCYWTQWTPGNMFLLCEQLFPYLSPIIILCCPGFWEILGRSLWQKSDIWTSIVHTIFKVNPACYGRHRKEEGLTLYFSVEPHESS